MRRLPATLGAPLLALAALFAATPLRAADGPVAPEWPAIDALVEVDLLTPKKLKEPIVIDLATGGGADKCPTQAWTGQAIFLMPGGEELVYWGTGIYCAPIGYGRIEYSDGRAYIGQVNSFLASASATLTQQQFRPAVRHGNGKLLRKGTTLAAGSFERGQLIGDRMQDPAFLKAFDAAEASLPDRFAPMMTSAVAAFTAMPKTTTPNAAAAVPASAPMGSAKISDSVAAAGAQAVAEMTASSPAAAAPAGGAGGSLFTAAVATSGGNTAAGASGAGGGSYTGGGALALPAPLPSDYNDMAGMMGFVMPNEAAAAQAKQLDKQYELKARNNGIFYGAACPKAGFLGLKPWRARVVYTETFSGRIVYDGVGFGCGPLGPGRVEFEDGSVFEGQVSTFTKSQMNPIGNFEPAVPSGPGRFTFPDGTVIEGTWLRGELNGGPMSITKPGGQPQPYASGTLAAVRAGGGLGGGSAGPSDASMQGVAAAAAASMLSGSAPVGATSVSAGAPAGATPFTPSAAQPFAPAGSAGLPFTPAGVGGAVAAGGPGKAGPQPMLGNAGKYLCPYTEDGVVAQWVDKAIKARMGGAIGGMVGTEVGKEVFKNIPMLGGMFGKMAGDKMGREVAIKMAGGWEFIKANSDQSFDNVNDYVTWMKMNYKGTEHYNDVVLAIKELYPELKTMQF